MPDPVNLVRPDGTILQVSQERADKLKALGSDLREEETGEAISRNREEGRQNYYEDQKLETFVEGAASGLTLGATDYLTEQVLGWDSAERANYNPGTRLAGEIVGGIAPALVAPEGSIGKLLAKTPAGAVSAVAGRAGAAVGGGVRGATAAGAVEGAVLGAAAETTNATLSGDPLTAESIIAGMGWGAVLGGGLGALTAGAGKVADEFATKRAADVARHTFPEVEYNALRSSLTDARAQASKAVTTAERELAEAAKAGVDPKIVVDDLSKAVSTRKEIQERVVNEITAAGQAPKIAEIKKANFTLLNEAAALAAKGDVQGVERVLETHANRMRNLEVAAGRDATALEAFRYVPAGGQAPEAAIEEMKNLALIRDALDGIPATPAGFLTMKTKKLEDQVAAIDNLMKTGGAELEGIRVAVKDSLAATAKATGVMVDGSPGEQLRALWELGKATSRKAGREAASNAKGGFRMLESTARYAGGRAAASGLTGAGRVAAYGLGSSAVHALVGLKGHVTGALSDAVAKWAPRVAKGSKAALKVNAPARVDPLRTRLDGSVDMEKKSRKQLMKERSEEFSRNAVNLRSKLFTSLEGAAMQHPQFAATMIDTAEKQFRAMSARVPRDPGTMMANMKSMWSADPVSIEKFARAYEVFQNPVAVARKAIQETDISPEAARALREFNPELFQIVRVGMLERLSDPEVLGKLTYKEQVNLGRLLDITVHSSQTPRFIAAQQQMFAERNQPLAVRQSTSISNNPSGGRPPGAGSAAGQITNH